MMLGILYVVGGFAAVAAALMGIRLIWLGASWIAFRLWLWAYFPPLPEELEFHMPSDVRPHYYINEE